PMDMALMGWGEPRVPIQTQHDQLHALAQAHPGRVLPFCAVEPRRGAAAMQELRRCVEELGFHGVKLYPPLGYLPTHELLMEQVYPYCIERNIPVMSHCSQGGVAEKGSSQATHDERANPHAFIPVLERFPDLRVCLAHFGGDAAWNDFLGPHAIGKVRSPAEQDENNWLHRLLDMLRAEVDGQPKYPGLYTDISYTAFRFRQNLPALDVFLSDDRVADKVLFGSDYFMTETEETSERRMSIELRYAIGEANFRRIAERNPCHWLDGPQATCSEEQPPQADPQVA
ncbi:MAG: amidohydrolase family protein, partial [Pseudomonadota bacterium]